MAQLRDATWFRLSAEGVACDERGAFVGSVALLTATRNDRDVLDWAPRSLSELNAELSDNYGWPIDLAAKLAGLSAIARALNERNTPLAQIAMLHLRLPDPPKRSTGARQSGDIAALPIALLKSGILNADAFDPLKHPRWPAGAPEGEGGKFRPVTAADATPSDNTQDHTGTGNRAPSPDYVERNSPEDLKLPDGTAIIEPTAGTIIQKPKFVDIQSNIDFAIALRTADANSVDPMTALFTFRFLFPQYGPMDYQRSGSDGTFLSAEGKDRFDSRYTAFSSFNLGLMGYWAGLPLPVLIMAAGRYNRQVNPKSAERPSGNPMRNEGNIELGYRLAPLFRPEE